MMTANFLHQFLLSVGTCHKTPEGCCLLLSSELACCHLWGLDRPVITPVIDNCWWNFIEKYTSRRGEAVHNTDDGCNVSMFSWRSSNIAEKFPCLLINWHWHWALSISPSISCIYVGIKQTHMPLKMIYSNFMSRIPPAVIFRKTSRHCSHHLCCAPPHLSLMCIFLWNSISNYQLPE